MSSDELVEIRHHIHSIAEVSGEEDETSSYIAETLDSYDADEITTGIGGNGILARYQGDKEGPTVLIRCELDALPIAEENDLDYLSKNEGVGHKCGHDGHMAILCGVAKKLSEEDISFGEVLLLFQPSEENGRGAQRILDDEKFEDINPDYAIALHNVPGFEKHSIVVRSGPFAAASVGFIARLKGETAHAAHPEQGKSPAAAVAQLIQGLSSLSQFNVSMDQAAKATIVESHIGEKAFGTSPGYGEVMATLRTYDDNLLKKLQKKAKELAEGVANTYEVRLKTEEDDPFSATINDDETIEIIRSVAAENDFDIVEKEAPFGWSEDFGHIIKKFKGALFGLGSGTDQPPLHAGNYDFPDEIIDTGVQMFIGFIKAVNKDS
ncbi:MAG TPA: amidohydrolase [Balneolaceae bacterium]|nr:amidohydrolase [Balneolaceae bacterium]